MGKQVTKCNNNLFVRSRLFDDQIDRVVVSNQKTGRAFYPNIQAFLNNITINDLNSAVIMGYVVSDLIIVAERLKAGGVDIMQFKDYNDGFKDGYARATADTEKAIQDSINKMFNGG